MILNYILELLVLKYSGHLSFVFVLVWINFMLITPVKVNKVLVLCLYLLKTVQANTKRLRFTWRTHLDLHFETEVSISNDNHYFTTVLQ